MAVYDIPASGLRCDLCGSTSGPVACRAKSPEEAKGLRESMKRNGWRFVSGKDVCRRCREAISAPSPGAPR